MRCPFALHLLLRNLLAGPLKEQDHFCVTQQLLQGPGKQTEVGEAR